ncbi:MAG: PHP domain-containing protein [Bacillota bacterium]
MVGGNRADLHVHSNRSDGLLAPEELVRRAYRAGLGCISLCDHDCIDGVGPAARRGEEMGVRVIPGVELSVWVKGGGDGEGGGRPVEGEVHLLGYGMRSSALEPFLQHLREERLRRLRRILRRLEDLATPLTEEEVLRVAAPSHSPGRPHVARALVRRGHCASVAEAFARLLGAGRPAYVPRERVSAREGIGAIRDAGGVPVAAHPGLGGTVTPLLESLVLMGVEGVEVVHQNHSLEVVRQLIHFARCRGLRCTGGSDFHGRPEDPPIGEVAVPLRWARGLI